MPDDPNAGAAGAGSTNTPPAGTPPAGVPVTPPAGSGAGASGGQDPPAPRTYDEAYVKKLNDECAARRVREKTLEDEVKALKLKDASELEKAQARIKELEEKTIADEKLRLEAEVKSRQADILAAVTEAGAKKPSIVAKLIDAGTTNLGKSITDLKKEAPELFNLTPGRIDAGAGGGGQKREARDLNSDMNAQIRRFAGRE